MRKNPENTSSSFGQSMKASKGAKKIATTVDDQVEILDESISGYVIEDTVRVGDLIVSLISSDEDDTAGMIEKLEKNPKVKYAEPNYEVESQSAGFSLNDEYIGYSYQLAGAGTENSNGENIYSRGTDNDTSRSSINATDIWADKNGYSSDEEIVVAVVDSGVDYNHEELKNHMWSTMTHVWKPR